MKTDRRQLKLAYTAHESTPPSESDAMKSSGFNPQLPVISGS